MTSGAVPTHQLFDLAGRVALVTGAARGLGAAMAEAIAEAGAHVILNDVDATALEQAQSRLSATGLSATASVFDVTDHEAVASSMKSIEATHGRLDILVNNAGIAIYGDVAELGLEDWRRVIDVDLTALYALARHASSLMSRTGHGRIINIASIMGLVARPGIISYVVAKHGVVGLTRALAGELGRHGITCNALAPAISGRPWAMCWRAMSASTG